MSVRYYGQSYYNYWIRIGVTLLICMNLCDRVVNGEGWSDSHTGWTKTPPVNNTGGPNQHTQLKIWVETLLALVI
jgi:hypothetical protein